MLTREYLDCPVMTPERKRELTGTLALLEQVIASSERAREKLIHRRASATDEVRAQLDKNIELSGLMIANFERSAELLRVTLKSEE